MMIFNIILIMGCLVFMTITITLTWVICSEVKEKKNVEICVKLMNDDNFKEKYIEWLRQTYTDEYIKSLS